MIRIAVDAMGGDNAPEELVAGAVEAVKERSEIKVLLIGQEDAVNRELSKYTYNKEQIEVIHASEVIATEEPPVSAVRKKKDSSLVVGMNMVRKGEADAIVSAGSTGAILVGGQVLVGRIKGVERPPLAVLIPTDKGVSLLLDGGANVDARPSHLVQFAKMGSIYMEHAMGVKNPRVAIVNIGAEEEKGNALVKETFPLLKACGDINFTGSIEAREIPHGGADVIVAEAFVGNVILKLYEGVGAALISKVKEGMMTSLRSKIGALLVKPALKTTLKSFDASRYGGAPLLGLKGLVVKTHGSSKRTEVKNSIIQCLTFTEQGVNAKIQESLKEKENGEAGNSDGI
jgi:glycerol-3-phosphate acyltransferase PlsX